MVLAGYQKKPRSSGGHIRCVRSASYLLRHKFENLVKKPKRIGTNYYLGDKIQSNFTGSNTFGTMKICSRQG